MDEQNKDSELKEKSDYGNVFEKPPQPQFTPEQQFNPRISPIAVAFIGLIGGFFLYQIVGGLLTLLIFGLDIENAPVNGIRLMTMQVKCKPIACLIFKIILLDVNSSHKNS
jgi:hypothetical protein